MYATSPGRSGEYSERRQVRLSSHEVGLRDGSEIPENSLPLVERNDALPLPPNAAMTSIKTMMTEADDTA
jgi:hypothetical protein